MIFVTSYPMYGNMSYWPRDHRPCAYYLSSRSPTTQLHNSNVVVIFIAILSMIVRPFYQCFSTLLDRIRQPPLAWWHQLGQLILIQGHHETLLFKQTNHQNVLGIVCHYNLQALTLKLPGPGIKKKGCIGIGKENYAPKKEKKEEKETILTTPLAFYWSSSSS